MTSSAYKMLSVEDATDLVLQNTPVLPTALAGLDTCLGHVLGETVTAREPLPPFPASMKVSRGQVYMLTFKTFLPFCNG